MTSPEMVPVKAGDIYAKEMAGEVFIFTSHDVRIHCLNRTGSRAWELMDGERSVGGIVEALGRELDVQPQRVEEDLALFIEQLAEKMIISLK